MSNSPALKDLSLGEDFRSTLVESTCYVLKTQAQVDVKLESIQPYDASKLTIKPAVIATVGISGEGVSGGVALGFPSDTFLKIANQMLGESYTVIDAQNRDLSGEFLNMIFGGIKSKFKDVKKIPLQLAIPIVMQSSELQFSFDTKTPTYMILFKSDYGPFFAVAAIVFPTP